MRTIQPIGAGSVLFAQAFDNPGLLRRIRQLRRNPLAGYAIALAAVVIATLVRLAVGDLVSATAPFVTYFLAILFAALACGLWPGMAAVLLSIVAAWFLFVPPAFSPAVDADGLWSLLIFTLVASINVALTSGLIAALLIEDDRHKFLIQELRHRSQNLFAVIQAIVSRSFVEGQTLSQAKQALNGRLAALARAHAMLADRAWVGAPLKKILEEELTGFVQQVSVAGCDLVINTTAAQNFALIVHELATNAAKHGALSATEGRVRISGSVEGCDGKQQFRFLWSESGGPPATPPARQGFGSAILFNMARSFGQNVEASYRPEGLTYELVVLLSAIAPPSNQNAVAT
jgi:two-component sensor histidine kinase